MKQKKKWVIPLCVIGVILLLCAGGLWYMTVSYTHLTLPTKLEV